MNEIELDDQVRDLVFRARRQSDQRTRLSDLLRQQFQAEVREDLLAFVVNLLVDKNYCESLACQRFEDDRIVYEAKTVAAAKKDGSRFYVPGDAHFFLRINDEQYLLGRMDGMSHGVKAGIIVLAARYMIQQCVNANKTDPKQIAEYLNGEIERLYTDCSFTTMLMTLLDESEVHITNVGDGDTFVYCPQKSDFQAVCTNGLPIGVLDSSTLSAMGGYSETSRKVLPGFTLVSYTDGINNREGFQESVIKELIIINHGNIKNTVRQIYEYAEFCKPIESDDATVIGLLLKRT